MTAKNKTLFFVENLSFLGWCFTVFPVLMNSAWKKEQGSCQIYYIDTTAAGYFFAKIGTVILNVKIERLNFRLVDIVDEEGNLLRLRLAYKDLAEIQDDILTDETMRKILNLDGIKDSRLKAFLEKQTVTFNWAEKNTVWRLVSLIYAASWKAQQEEGNKPNIVLFGYQRMWMKEIRKYAKRFGVDIVTLASLNCHPKEWIIQAIGEQRLRCMFYRYKCYGLPGIFRKTPKEFFVTQKGPPYIMADYQSQLNLDKPELFSDLFYWQESNIPAKNMKVVFNGPRDPVNKEKYDEIKSHNMSVVSRNPRATLVPEVPVFHYYEKKNKGNRVLKEIQDLSADRSVVKWAYQQVNDFQQMRCYWEDFFKKHNIKLYVSWWKLDANNCIIGEALRNVGGIATIYQRSFEEFSSPKFTTAVDVMFSFSKMGINVDEGSRSRIPYNVVTGYTGDHRFPLVAQKAKEIRGQLQQQGAEKILAYFDENSGADSRWHTGHKFMRVNYEFLLEKLIKNPWMGMVFKPKTPGTLMERLGPVAALMKEARETGRCFVFEQGLIQGNYSPAAAAMAADVAIHGHLSAVTAGVESALAGVPTLLVDREGWTMSSFYQLGEGKVVFKTWEHLWSMVCEHWQNAL